MDPILTVEFVGDIRWYDAGSYVGAELIEAGSKDKLLSPQFFLRDQSNNDIFLSACSTQI